jgi:hypothetical protein
MSERYRPRRLIRARVASGEPPTSPEQAIDWHQKYLREQRDKKLGGAPVPCRHGVAWVDCTACSKPKTKP